MSLLLSLPLTELLTADRKCHTCRLKICLHGCPTQVCISRKAEAVGSRGCVSRWLWGAVVWGGCQAPAHCHHTQLSAEAVSTPQPCHGLLLVRAFVFPKNPVLSMPAQHLIPPYQPGFPPSQGTNVWFWRSCLAVSFFVHWMKGARPLPTAIMLTKACEGVSLQNLNSVWSGRCLCLSECPQHLVH